MTDRELLKLAARAARLDEYDGWQAWNPLTDDSDALRLSVKLRMELEHNHPADQNWVGARLGNACVAEEFEDESQRAAATRRAIVRAAAAMAERSET